MEDRSHVKLFLVFFVFIVIIVGGYILMINSSKKTKTKNNTISEAKEEIEIRLDNTKEYIYYSDEEIITEELDINYVDVNINFKDNNNIAKKLNDVKNTLKTEIKYDKSNPDASYDGLTYVKYPKYENYAYKEYLSLVVDYFTFDNTNLVTYNNTEAYVFNKNTGKLYTKEDLLNTFNLTEDAIKSKVRDFVKDADLVNGDITLDAEASVSNISFNSLYVDKLGRLVISVLVKSSEKDYNEVIILS